MPPIYHLNNSKDDPLYRELLEIAKLQKRFMEFLVYGKLPPLEHHGFEGCTPITKDEVVKFSEFIKNNETDFSKLKRHE